MFNTIKTNKQLPFNYYATRNRLALRVFLTQVQRRARQIIDNDHAGSTTNEVQFIANYFHNNRSQSLSLAITICTCAMLDVFRRSELPRQS